MPQLEYFLVAESYAIDQFTNRISIFNVVEEVRGPQFPYRLNFAAISAWNAQEGDEGQDFQATLLVWVTGAPQPVEVRANFQMTNPRHRILQAIQGVEAHEAGEMTVEIQLNGVHAATHRISILPPFPPVQA